MAGLNSTNLSLMDVAKRLNPQGGVETSIAELLTQRNDVLLDMTWQEGNLPTGHRVVVRTGLPASTWRKINKGVAATKSSTIQVEEGIGMLEQKGAVDKDLASLNGNTAEFRLSENIPHMDAMNIDMTTNLFYGDASNPERFIGLSPRYNALTGVANSTNVISGSGSGSDNTSVWLLGWGPNALFGIYNKGSKAGLQHMTIQDNSGDGCMEVDDGTNTGATYRAYVDRYQWKCGIVVKDWRYAVRICNIDVSNLVAESSNADLIKLMSRAIDRIPTPVGVKLAFYCNRTVFSMLKIQALNKSANALSVTEALLQFGDVITKTKQLEFLGIPVRICDGLTLSEATIS